MKHGRSDYQHIQDRTGKIPDNEPVFLIRAQNPYSGDAVRHWANLHDRAKGDPRCSDQARILAREMDNWSTKKIADYPGQLPEGKFVPTIPPDEQRSTDPTVEDMQAAIDRIHQLSSFLSEAREQHRLTQLSLDAATLKLEALRATGEDQPSAAGQSDSKEPPTAKAPEEASTPTGMPSGRRTAPIAPGSMNT